MSFKAKLIKTAVNCTPNKVIIWVANILLKDIAELTDFNLDLENRQVYVQTYLNGEAEPIEVRVDGFAVLEQDATYQFLIQRAVSNKPWLNTILAKIVGKEWKLPVIPKYQAYIDLIAEVLKADPPVQQEDSVA